jgi:cobalt/nickel transport system permease protein
MSRPQQQPLPEWLGHNPVPDPVDPANPGRRRRGFIAKTLHGIAEVMRDEVFCESLAGRSGLLQRLDPRVKALTVLLLIGAAGLLHHMLSLVCLNLWLFWLARVSRVPLTTFIKRVWIVVPLFTGIVVIPVVFNVVRPGTPLLVLFQFAHPRHLGFLTIPAQVTITREGTAAAALLVLRVGASVSLAVLLTLTTRWQALLKALGVLRIPVLFLTVLEMTYRYIFVLLQISSDLFMARRSRLVGRISGREERRFVTSAMGQLWAKTHATSEEVHDAMRSRGYTGQPRTLTTVRMKASDWLWSVLVLLVAVVLVGGDRVLG